MRHDTTIALSLDDDRSGLRAPALATRISLQGEARTLREGQRDVLPLEPLVRSGGEPVRSEGRKYRLSLETNGV